MAQEPTDRPSSTAFFYLLVGLLYAAPLAGDLARRIPAERFALWPLSRVERALVHAVNLALNPLLVVAVLFAALSRHPGVKAGLLVSGIAAPFAAYALRRFRGLPAARMVPAFPGRLGGLIQNHVREYLRMLDVYFAAALAAGGVLYRLFDAHADRMAAPVIGLLLVIMMSTLAQAHLAFDASQDDTRVRLLPISRAAALFAKDAAWLSIMAVLTACYASLPVAAGALAALTVGHSTAARPRIEQRRGHFASGTLWPAGIVQVLAIVAAGAATLRFGMAAAALAAVAYFASLPYSARSVTAGSMRAERRAGM